MFKPEYQVLRFSNDVSTNPSCPNYCEYQCGSINPGCDGVCASESCPEEVD